MPRPKSSDYPEFFAKYISLVPETDIREVMASSLLEIQHFLSALPTEKADFAYAPGKWTVKQVLQHTIDAERIFMYRALSIARGEKQSLPGFDENEYAKEADVSERSLKELKDELLIVRQTAVQLFNSFVDPALVRSGISNEQPINVLSLGYIIIGHMRHHQKILAERYEL